MGTKQHKQYIAEWKSINEDVKILSDYIAAAIWEDSQNLKPYLDKKNLKPFIKGNIIVDVNSCFKDDKKHFEINKLDVKYIMYLVDSYDEYYNSLEHNSWSSYEDRTMTIVFAVIEGKVHPEFLSDIYHEVEHLFQYGMGMQKRIDLYDAIVEELQNNNNTELQKAMCRLIYYTFSHEQDAFANQFYAFLKTNKPTISFDELLYTSTEYVHFYNDLMHYNHNINKNRDEGNELLQKLGMTFEQFNKRIHFGGKRLKNKLKNVYDRHQYELKESNFGLYKARNKIRWNVLMEYKKRYKDIKFEDSDTNK